jgi:signal transduction histidine kinase
LQFGQSVMKYANKSNKVIVLFVGTVMLLALGMVVSFWTYGQIGQTDIARKNTRFVISSVNNLLSMLVDAETGQRGYLLTGDEAFLDAYKAAQKDISTDMVSLHQLLKGSATRQRLEVMSPLVEAKMAELKKIIQLRRNNDSTGAITIVKAGQGKVLMDQIRAQSQSIIQMELMAVEQNEADFRSIMSQMFIILVTLSLLAVLFAFAFIYYVYRGMQQRITSIVYLKASALQKAIFNSANFSYIATDAKGVIQIFNVGAERMLGYSASDLINKVTPADISDMQEMLVRAKSLSDEFNTLIQPGFEALVFKAARGIEDIYDLTYIRKDGSNFPAVVSVTALRDDQKSIIGYLLIGTDNTARKQVLEARERMIQIEKLSSLGTMVGGVAHEINNPLMGVMNYVEYARDKATDAKSIEVLDSALYEIDRIREIVQHMLVFVHVDHSHDVKCNVYDAVKHTVALLGGEFKKNAVLLQIDLPEHLPEAKCSAGSLQQVLVNLLLNARDALAGQLEQRITITAQQGDGKITLSVCDNGPGVSEEFRQKIFDPFFTTKPIGKGTGLGLAVSQQLLEEVGGSLSYEDHNKHNPCFHIVLGLA